MLLRQFCIQHKLDFLSATPISGGDINEAYSIITKKGRLFLKFNSAIKFPKLFAREAEGLKALKAATTLEVPAVKRCGVWMENQYLLLEHLEKAPGTTADFWQVFAQGLAQLHSSSSEKFGWKTSNYIGSILQVNRKTSTWAEFYAEQRVLPLCDELFLRQRFTSSDLKAAERMCENFYDIFPEEKPSLLHGDLWAGNFMPVRSGDNIVPAIFDPAVYYGHREMDIGMSLLFGGFDKAFYDFYNDYFPLEKDWQKRTRLTQLYPLLVHAVLFGGNYIQECRSIIQAYR